MANLGVSKFPAYRSEATVAMTTGATGLSEVADLTGGALAAIEMPSTWTDAVLTMLVGRSSGELFNVFGSTGDEITFTTTGSRMVLTDPVAFAGMRYFQLRSGTAAAPVAQAVARTFKLHYIG